MYYGTKYSVKLFKTISYTKVFSRIIIYAWFLHLFSTNWYLMFLWERKSYYCGPPPTTLAVMTVALLFVGNFIPLTVSPAFGFLL